MFFSLLAHKEEIWKDLVTVVATDMRNFNPPEKADILVSELLGSFGDNELSPECLDGAQKFLKGSAISKLSFTRSCVLFRNFRQIYFCRWRNFNSTKLYVVCMSGTNI